MGRNEIEWRPIVGFEGLYEASNAGRVRSCRTGKLLAECPHSGGYLMSHLYKDGVREARTNHKIVASAFLGPRPEGQEVMHLDGDKTNNSVVNLAYGTRLENESHKALHGTLMRGERNHVAKLTADDVRAIRARRGERQEDLAEEYGCTFSNISAIQRRKSWRHV